MVHRDQFNPLVEDNTFTNDASLLLPSNTVGIEYLAMSWKHRTRMTDQSGFITIIAPGPEPAQVSVTPAAEIREGGATGTDQ